MDSSDALSRSRCRERWLNKSSQSVSVFAGDFIIKYIKASMQHLVIIII